MLFFLSLLLASLFISFLFLLYSFVNHSFIFPLICVCITLSLILWSVLPSPARLLSSSNFPHSSFFCRSTCIFPFFIYFFSYLPLPSSILPCPFFLYLVKFLIIYFPAALLSPVFVFLFPFSFYICSFSFLFLFVLISHFQLNYCQSRWPCGLRRGSAAACLLEFRVRIRLGSW